MKLDIQIDLGGLDFFSENMSKDDLVGIIKKVIAIQNALQKAIGDEFELSIKKRIKQES